MEKIYIVVVHQVDDFAELALSTKPFSSIDKAKEYFNPIVADDAKVALRELSKTIRIDLA